MKTSLILSGCICVGFLLSGCQSGNSALSGTGQNIYAPYYPAKAGILPLSELTRSDKEQGKSTLKVYVSLRDSFGSQQKNPAIFRFELYEYVQRNARPKGKRIFTWPDIDLMEFPKNSQYWRDHLRAYEFTLALDSADAKSYVLQVTCLCLNGKRLSDESLVKYSN